MTRTFSFKLNIIANYLSQLYVTLIGIVIIPLYIEGLGAEAYGLIGFFALLQSWFNLLDIGLTPTVSRETARFTAGVLSPLDFKRVVRALTVVFWCIAISGGCVLFFSTEFIANSWLNVESLPNNTVIFSLEVISICVALRWVSGVSRGVITGREKLVWLSSFNSILASLRFLGVLLYMELLGYTLFNFFCYQLVIALLELFILTRQVYLLTPRSSTLPEKVGWSFSPIKPLLLFSMSIAFTSSVWVLITQTDKLILSGILSLSQYAYFSLAVLAASGILILSGPISSALMPRLAKLYATNKFDELVVLYKKSTQLVVVIAVSVSTVISLGAEYLIFAWTGDLDLTKQSAPILQLYSIGNGILVIAAFPYYIQYAIGKLKLHLIGNIILALTLIPSIVISSINYGALGAGWAWLLSNLFYFVFWVGYVHKKLVPNLHIEWLLNDVLRITIPVLLVSIMFFSTFDYAESRTESLLFLILGAILALLIATLSSNFCIQTIKNSFYNRSENV